MTEASDGQAPWIDLGSYAERTSQHIDAVRSAVRRGRLKARKGNDGRWLVPLPTANLPQPALGSDAATASVMPAPASVTPASDLGKAEPLAKAVTEALAELQTVLTEARADATAARAEAARLREELGASRLAHTRAEERAKSSVAAATAGVEAAHRVAAEAVAARDEVLAEVRRALEHERARADRIEAEARRSWWSRLLGRWRHPVPVARGGS